MHKARRLVWTTVFCGLILGMDVHASDAPRDMVLRIPDNAA